MKRRSHNNNEAPSCKCGCRQALIKGRNGRYALFIRGHNSKSPKSNQTAKTGNHGRFPAGVSGNPKGRPQGSKHKSTIAVQQMFLGEAEAISRHCIDAALSGSMVALKLCIDRIVPVVKSAPITIDLPVANTIDEVAGLSSFILNAVATGKITPLEGEILSRNLSRHAEVLKARDLEKKFIEIIDQLSNEKA